MKKIALLFISVSCFSISVPAQDPGMSVSFFLKDKNKPILPGNSDYKITVQECFPQDTTANSTVNCSFITDTGYAADHGFYFARWGSTRTVASYEIKIIKKSTHDSMEVKFKTNFKSGFRSSDGFQYRSEITTTMIFDAITYTAGVVEFILTEDDLHKVINFRSKVNK